jgi:hypothetical protein
VAPQGYQPIWGVTKSGTLPAPMVMFARIDCQLRPALWVVRMVRPDASFHCPCVPGEPAADADLDTAVQRWPPSAVR